jgi:GrpB-like predicted nucleotidyltransferase (UPF0157 family)
MFQVGKYETAAATFADYDPHAPQIAQLLKQALEQREPRVVVEHIGFQKQSGREPFPETRPMRIAAVFAIGDTFRVHAHVIERNGAEHRELIAFRDALRRDPNLRIAYERTKEQILARGITDSLDDSKAKGSFIVGQLSALLTVPDSPSF